MHLAASAVVVDLAANSIRLTVPELAGLLTLAPGTTVDAELDVGASGRLLGVAVGDLYVGVMDPLPGTEALVRSVPVAVRIADVSPPTISLPRLGPTWEIAYPSGNECWRVTVAGGRLVQLCAVTAGEPSVPPDASARHDEHP